MRTSFCTALLLSAGTTFASASQYAIIPKVDTLDFEPAKLRNAHAAPAIIATSMPQSAANASETSSTIITLPEPPQAQNHERRATESAGKTEGLTARQVVGAIAVAVLVAVV